MDPRLMMHPQKIFKNQGWTDCYDFFGNKRPNLYKNYDEAKKAAKKLGIKSRLDYIARYKSDTRLPFNPRHSYKNKGWLDWYAFLDIDKP